MQAGREERGGGGGGGDSWKCLEIDGRVVFSLLLLLHSLFIKGV